MFLAHFGDKRKPLKVATKKGKMFFIMYFFEFAFIFWIHIAS